MEPSLLISFEFLQHSLLRLVCFFDVYHPVSLDFIDPIVYLNLVLGVFNARHYQWARCENVIEVDERVPLPELRVKLLPLAVVFKPSKRKHLHESF